jgi:hypothetical protein
MMNVIQNDIDLWEVWIEYDQFHPEYFGTLYVHGEISADKKNCSDLIKLATDSKGQLSLQLPERPQNVHHTTEVVYSEPIKNLNQYTSVCIYSGQKLVGCFDDIEIMI